MVSRAVVASCMGMAVNYLVRRGGHSATTVLAAVAAHHAIAACASAALQACTTRLREGCWLRRVAGGVLGES